MELFEVYPNPADEAICLQQKQSTYLSYGQCQVEVINSRGQRIAARVWHMANPLRLDLTNCAPGLYMVRLKLFRGSNATKYPICTKLATCKGFKLLFLPCGFTSFAFSIISLPFNLFKTHLIKCLF
ncbi:MAG: T9SS type A sorting domain-containing protein [Owenweeksia sp.]|nr:T9SS type A sorting domain-containing protein [Owenweeksia sp.]